MKVIHSQPRCATWKPSSAFSLFTRTNVFTPSVARVFRMTILDEMAVSRIWKVMRQEWVSRERIVIDVDSGFAAFQHTDGRNVKSFAVGKLAPAAVHECRLG